MHGFQQREFTLHRPVQVPLFKDKQEAVALQPAQKPVVFLGPLGDGIVELGIQCGNGALRQILGQFLKVVNKDNAHHRAGADILVPNLVQLCQVAQIQHAHHKAIVFPGVDGNAVDPVAALVHRNIVGAFILTGGKPVGGKAWDDLLQSRLHQ